MKAAVRASIHERMEGARVHSKGVLPIHIAFFTQEAVDAARAWMVGKRRVNTLTPVLWTGKRPEGVSAPELKG